jgi:DNA polymerase, archaea type
MVYKIDYVDGDVLRWSVTETGVECEVDESYTPTIYVSVHGDGEFSTARAALRDHPAVVRATVVDERVSFRHDPEQVLLVDVVDLKAVNSVARMVSKWGSPGEYRCYNVDFSREFRYCLEKEIDPLPNHELSQMQITLPETELASGLGRAKTAFTDGGRVLWAVRGCQGEFKAGWLLAAHTFRHRSRYHSLSGLTLRAVGRRLV